MLVFNYFWFDFWHNYIFALPFSFFLCLCVMPVFVCLFVCLFVYLFVSHFFSSFSFFPSFSFSVFFLLIVLFFLLFFSLRIFLIFPLSDPAISLKSLSLWNCEKVGTSRYLINDFSLECNGAYYTATSVFNVLFTIGIVVGWPGFLLYAILTFCLI